MPDSPYDAYRCAYDRVRSALAGGAHAHVAATMASAEATPGLDGLAALLAVSDGVSGRQQRALRHLVAALRQAG